MLARADMRDGFDLDLGLGGRERRDLYQGRGREIAGEKLASRLPHLFAVFDVGDEDRDLDEFGDAAAGGFDEMLDLGEDGLRLGVFAWAGGGRGGAGEIGDAA